MQKTAWMMSAAYAILAWFVESMQLLEKLSDSAKLLLKHRRMALNAFMARLHSTFPAEEDLVLDANSTHWDPAFNSAILDCDKKEREE